MDETTHSMAPFIYINGYPGVGKLTVAKELCQHFSPARVLHNHLLIDPVAAVFDRTAPEYQPLRQVLRREVLKSLATSTSTRDTTWIFTDSQSSSPLGSTSARDYKDAAVMRGSLFFSIILHCELNENLTRATSGGRGSGHNTKLADPSILQMIREKEDIFHFNDPFELELDVTHISPQEAAARIYAHIARYIASQDTDKALKCPPGEETNQKTYPPAEDTDKKTCPFSEDSNEKTPKSQPRGLTDIQGFKHEFINELRQGPPGRQVRMICWLGHRPRHHGSILFLPAVDSTGAIQVVVESSKVSPHHWSELKALKPESSLNVVGLLSANSHSTGNFEIAAQSVGIISAATGTLHPDIRHTGPSILEAQHTHAVLSNRHLYLRNPVIIALNLYRSHCLSEIHSWFKRHKFVEVSAPLITPSILYEPNSAIHLSNLLKTNKSLFLSQCAGFYLEAAAHAHERVYNLGPSFRNESRTNRHLMEYWHIKAELCSGQMDDIMDLVEIFLRDIFQTLSEHTDKVTKLLGTQPPRFSPPFPRITYRNALALLNSKGHDMWFGQNISKPAEDFLTSHFGGPVWVTHKPRSLEPFPYRVHPADDELTMTADLISSGGFGEICGVAEKSFTREELELRMREKGKLSDNVALGQEVYGWVLASRDFGMVPHTAFGIGFERVLRWLCGVGHVKDVIPFPRIFGRDPIP